MTLDDTIRLHRWTMSFAFVIFWNLLWSCEFIVITCLSITTCEWSNLTCRSSELFRLRSIGFAEPTNLSLLKWSAFHLCLSRNAGKIPTLKIKTWKFEPLNFQIESFFCLPNFIVWSSCPIAYEPPPALQSKRIPLQKESFQMISNEVQGPAFSRENYFIRNESSMMTCQWDHQWDQQWNSLEIKHELQIFSKLFSCSPI